MGFPGWNPTKWSKQGKLNWTLGKYLQEINPKKYYKILIKMVLKIKLFRNFHIQSDNIDFFLLFGKPF